MKSIVTPLWTRLPPIFLVLLTSYIAVLWLSWKPAGSARTAKQSDARQASKPLPKEEALTPLHATNDAGDAERDQQIQEVVAHWSKCRARLRQISTVDYPAALAARRAAEPNFHAIKNFLNYSGTGFLREHDADIRRWRQWMAEHKENPAADKLLNLERFLSFIQTLNDPTPVIEGTSVGDVINRLFVMPADTGDGGSIGKGGALRRETADIEQKVFEDAEAAQRVNALQTVEDLKSYWRESLPRYQATSQQLAAELPLDDGLRAFWPEFAHAMSYLNIASTYQSTFNAKADQLFEEYSQERTTLPKILGQLPEDTAQTRQILTELSEIAAQMEAATSADERPPVATGP